MPHRPIALIARYRSAGQVRSLGVIAPSAVAAHEIVESVLADPAHPEAPLAFSIRPPRGHRNLQEVSCRRP